MASQSALELLPPELQQRITLHLESFDALYALILASPRIYQVFRLNRRIILSNVARRRFDQATIRAALAVEDLCRIETPPFSRDTVLKFFEPPTYDTREPHDLVLPLSVSTKMGQLDRIIGFFTHDYAQNTLPILEQLKRSEHATVKTEYKHHSYAPVLEISETESRRFRRAFCRFETYRQLFSRCSSKLDHDLRRCSYEPSLTAYEQAEKFFQDMPAYQIAEIACVRDYLHRRLRGVFDQIEDEVVKRLQDGCPSPKDQNQGLDWDWENGARHQYLSDDEHYFGYSGKYKQSYHIEYLMALGLPYICKLLESAGDERHDLLLRDDYRCRAQMEDNFITAALGLDTSHRNGQLYGWFTRKIDDCLDENSKLDLPPGWLWAHTGDLSRGLVNFFAKGLRDWGYIFWDLERLQKFGIMDLA